MSELHELSAGESPERSFHTPQARPAVDPRDPRAAQIQTVRALTAEGYELEEQDHAEDALAVFRHVIEEYGKSSEPEIREEVAFALLRTGLILCFVHRRAEAAAALGALLKSFKPGESKAIAEYLELARDRHQKLTFRSSR